MNNRIALRLRCPVCSDANIAFHSDLRLPINKSHEEVAIFVCGASHTFFVPHRGLNHALSKAQKESCERSSHPVARLDAARHRLLGIREKHCMLREKLQDSFVSAHRTRSQLAMTRMITKHTISETIAGRIARLNARLQPIPGLRQKEQQVMVCSTRIQ